MILCGILGGFEIAIILIFMVLVIFPAVKMVSARRRNSQYTEKLDQLERLERLFRDGSISQKEYNRQKKKLFKK
ncbi:MAG: SHOCT domain-containing protein [Bacteroidales bacterium]|jgi:uncharacterized membrane protein|nr:SHOCT domain-containing protein [Bacteroidales bacterium]